MIKKRKISRRGTFAVLFFLTVIVLIFFLNFIFMHSNNNENKSAFLQEGEFDIISEKTLYINELMTSNPKIHADENGEFHDWIELYNKIDVDIDLSGFTLSDRLEKSWNFPVNTIIRAKSYLLVYCSGEQRSGLYANFKLSKEGSEVVYLKNQDGNIVDSVKIIDSDSGNAMVKNEAGIWDISNKISPLYENSNEGRLQYLESRINLDNPLKISEFMVKNTAVFRDSFNEFSDWIELTNYGEKDIDLQNYFLSDDESNLYKWKFPAVSIKKGESLLIISSGKDLILQNGEIHTNFKLDNNAGIIYLTDNRGILIDRVSYSDINQNFSYMRTSSGFVQTALISPGYENSEEGGEQYYKNSEKLSDIVINEVMVQNDFYYPVDGGKYYDLIELKNISSKALSLDTYYLSNDNKNLKKYKLPDKVLQSGEIIVIIASGDSAATTKNYAHTNFKLNSKEDCLYLSQGENIQDSVYLSGIPYGASYGRNENGYGFYYMENPTPASENINGTRSVTPLPEVNHESGIYDGINSLKLDFYSAGDMFYTLDGSIPTRESIPLQGSIEIFQSSVIRLRAYEKGKFQSDVMTLSYIVNENHSLPVISLVTDPVNLWDELSGIYANGPNAALEFPYTGANFYEDWEKDANISYFEEGKTAFSLNCGIKIFGQSGRAYPKKSFQIKFRKKYGQEYLRYPLFDSLTDITRYDSIVLRSGSQDYKRTMIRDELCTGLVAGQAELLTQAYSPCVLYLNGEYWGIYFIREKIDEDYLSQHLNVSPESVTLLRGNSSVIYGSNREYQSLIYYVKNTDLTVKENYDYVLSKIDVMSYIDYHIAQAFCGNIDTSNIKFYKSTETDNKWRWIFFDLDYGFDYAHSGHFYKLYYLIKPEGTGYESKFNNDLIKALLTNAEFADLFLKRYAYHLNNTFAEERVISSINGFYNLLQPEMTRNCELWSLRMSDWKWYISTLRDFVKDGNITRKDVLITEAAEIFALSEEQVNMYFYMESEEGLHDA